jgi:GNAT superfamily N-acetyltransferase
MTGSSERRRMTMGEKKNPQLETRIDFSNIPGQVAHFRVFAPGKCETPVGYALVTHDGGECILWNIYVEPSFRRHGLASKLIKALKGMFPYIITSYTSQHGKRLCEKNGFIFEPSTNFLVWENEKNKADKK